MVDEQSNNLPAVTNSQILNKTSKSLGKIIESRGYQADEVPHLDLSQIRWIIETVQKNRHGDRDALLVRTIFDGCFRCSEAIGIRPRDIVQVEAGWQVNTLGKGQKWGTVAISASLAAMLQAYAYRIGIKPEDRIFPINRTRVFQIVQRAMRAAGIEKPDGVGSVHVLRHSGALERLKETKNPKAVQEQLRHRSAQMTLRYMKTLTHEESVKIQQNVDYKW